MRIDRHACRLLQRRARRMRIAAAFAVGEDIDLDLPHAAIELLIERLMRIVQPAQGVRSLLLEKCAHARQKAGVIAVVRADDLNLVDAHLRVAIGCAVYRLHTQACRQQRGGKIHCFHSEPCLRRRFHTTRSVTARS